ncbi:MAG: FtsX-like permease family protein [Phycisphaerales bacterium]
MYHALLSNRYLTSRVIPMVAVGAVALCVALVIIVVSVMTGFLNMVRSSGRTLMGDVIVAYPVNGIPHYQRLIARIEALPEAAAASPVVDGWGLLRMPYPVGTRKDTKSVQFWAIEPASFARVTGYDDTLYWRPPSGEMSEADYRHKLPPQRLAQALQEGRTLRDADGKPGIALGVHVSIANERQSDGSIRPIRPSRPNQPSPPTLSDFWWMPHYQVTLTAQPTAGGTMVTQPKSVIFPVVNEFFSGVYLIDESRVMIPLDVGQEMLHLNEGKRIDEEQLDELGMPTVIGIDPARATMVLVRAVEGVAPADLRLKVEAAYDVFQQELFDKGTLVPPPLRFGGGVSIKTWEQQQAKFIQPIEKERELMRTLFSLVYLVCAGLVLSIFWAIVYEKTRDIGILRSIGASRLGISWIFLRYGLVIGVGGAVFGLGLAYLIVRNINAIHGAMGDPPIGLIYITGGLALASLLITIVRSLGGRLLPMVLGVLVTVTLVLAFVGVVMLKRAGGVVIWDPSVYYFSEIPNELDRQAAVITMIGAVLFSLIGAFLPAAKAADVDPVKALRYE